MKAVHLGPGGLEVRDDVRPAAPEPGESTVRVHLAGICATDLALAEGYMGFRGIPGHEFVGVALDGPLAGERVVGEINAACGSCRACADGLGRHCPERTVLGILGRPGAFAETISLPSRNLLPVPSSISDEAAVFTEPLAAAFEIAEQVPLAKGDRAVVAGDGRLGLLCAWVLHLHGLEVTVAGHHASRQDLLPSGAAHRTGMLDADVAWHEAPKTGRFDLAVEATGRPEVLGRLVSRVRPRGTIVLKTTSERLGSVDTAPMVVNELHVVGSRCGRFAPALRALESNQIPVERWIEGRYPLDQAREAFEHAARPGTLKILFEIGAR